jgi:hypothetical protein
MSIDCPHINVVTGLTFATVLAVQRAPAHTQGSRAQRAVMTGIAAGLVTFASDLIWPDGDGADVAGESGGGREQTTGPQSEPAGGELPGQCKRA